MIDGLRSRGPSALWVAAIFTFAAGPALATTCGDLLAGATQSLRTDVTFGSGPNQVVTQVFDRARLWDSSVAPGDLAGAWALADFAGANGLPYVATTTYDTAEAGGEAIARAQLELPFVTCSGPSPTDALLGISIPITFRYALSGRIAVPDWQPLFTAADSLRFAAGRSVASFGRGGGTDHADLLGNAHGSDFSEIVRWSDLLDGIPDVSYPRYTYNPLDERYDIVAASTYTPAHFNANPVRIYAWSQNSHRGMTGPARSWTQTAFLGATTSASVPDGAGLLFANGLFVPLGAGAAGTGTVIEANSEIPEGTLRALPEIEAFDDDPFAVPAPGASALLAMGTLLLRRRR